MTCGEQTDERGVALNLLRVYLLNAVEKNSKRKSIFTS